MNKTTTSLWLALLSTASCSGAEEGEPEVSTAEYGCLHVAEGTILDVSPERTTARTIELGREPYRINLLPDEPGFVRVDTQRATDVVVLLDHVGAMPALWRGDDREELTGGDPNPFCDEDVPELHEVQLGSGANWLELGPTFQANVWVLIATP